MTSTLTQFILLTFVGAILLYLISAFVPLPQPLKKIAMIVLGAIFLIWFTFRFLGVYGVL